MPLAGTPTALTIASARKATRAVIASSIPMTVHHVSTNHRLFFDFFSLLATDADLLSLSFKSLNASL